MDFGLRLPEGGTNFDPAIELAEWAESQEITSVYFGEHGGFPESPYWPAPFLGLASIASRTDSVKLGTHIAQLPLYNPVRLAGTIAELDGISDGRIRPGFGVGWRRHEYDAMGVPFSERGARATEYLQILDNLLRGNTTFHGEFFDYVDYDLTPTPKQRPRPPLYVGGWSKPAMRRAGETGDGWLSPGGSLEQNRQFVDDFRKHGGGVVVIGSEGVVVRETLRESNAAVREFLIRRRKPHVREGNENVTAQFDSWLHEQGRTLPRSTPEQIERYTTELVDFELNESLETYTENKVFFAGTPAMVVDQIQRVIDKTECDEIIFRPHVADLSEEEIWTTVDLLGAEVLPSFT